MCDKRFAIDSHSSQPMIVTSTRLQHERDYSAFPVTILSRILLLAAGENVDNELDLSRYGITYSHICRYWRTVVLDTPRFWSVIHFRDIERYQGPKEFLARATRRGAKYPLNIRIRLSVDKTIEEHAVQEDSKKPPFSKDNARSYVISQAHLSLGILKIILPHVENWKSLEIKADYHIFQWLWLPELSKIKSVPNLSHLSLYSNDKWGIFHPSEFEEAVPLFSDGAPMLRSVILWGVHIDWSFNKIFQGLSHLKLAHHFRQVGMTPKQLSQILGSCPELEALTIWESQLVQRYKPHGCARIRLPRLHTLELATSNSMMESADGYVFLTLIENFPALKNLTLSIQQWDMSGFVNAIYREGTWPFETVENLQLLSFLSDVYTSWLFMAGVPNITSLTINFTYIGSDFCKEFVNRPALLPWLKTMKIGGLPHYSLHDRGNIRDLLIVRQDFPTPIKHLSLYQDTDTGIYTEEQIKWVRERVEVVEVYPPEISIGPYSRRDFSSSFDDDQYETDGDDQ